MNDKVTIETIQEGRIISRQTLNEYLQHIMTHLCILSNVKIYGVLTGIRNASPICMRNVLYADLLCEKPVRTYGHNFMYIKPKNYL